MGDGLFGFDPAKQDRQYTDKPNESWIRGLLNALVLEPATSVAQTVSDTEADYTIQNTQKQPWMMGEDSIASGGKSPSYPEFRTYNDYAEYNFPAPSVEQYTAFDGMFDEQGYNQAMMEYHNARSEHPQGTDW